MATLFRSDFVEIAYYAATYVFISVLRSIELAQYLATLLKGRVRKPRVYLKSESGNLAYYLATLFRSDFVKHASYAAAYTFISVLRS